MSNSLLYRRKRFAHFKAGGPSQGLDRALPSRMFRVGVLGPMPGHFSLDCICHYWWNGVSIWYCGTVPSSNGARLTLARKFSRDYRCQFASRGASSTCRGTWVEFFDYTTTCVAACWHKSNSCWLDSIGKLNDKEFRAEIQVSRDGRLKELWFAFAIWSGCANRSLY